MTSENSKPGPREFWIRFHIGDSYSTHQITDVSMNPMGFKEDFHVIEKSAYAALQQSLAQVTAERDELVEMLKTFLPDGFVYDDHCTEMGDEVEALLKKYKRIK